MNKRWLVWVIALLGVVIAAGRSQGAEVTRPLDGSGDGTPRCDIGAHEYDGPPPLRAFLPAYYHNYMICS